MKKTLFEYEKTHLKQLRKIAPECMVLLKSNGDFPLEGPGKIALYGSGVRKTLKGGTGSGDVNSRYVISVERGLRRAGFTITTETWLDTYDAVLAEARREFIADIKKKAYAQHRLPVMVGMGAVMPEPEYEIPLDGGGDTAIYVLSRICGEGNDRNAGTGDFALSVTERRDILALQKTYKRFLLVLNVGGPVDLTPVMEVENILLLGQLGAITGLAFTDVLLGKSYPSGKLSATWAPISDYPSVGTFGEKDDTFYHEGIYVGYRYFDSVQKEPLFPFGFGKSYTTFKIGKTSVEAEDTVIRVKAKVKNTGERKGKEVVQLYVSVPSGRLDQPYQSLAAYAKTGELEPQASEEVMLCFDLRDQAGFDTDACAYILEKGKYLLRIGTSSRETEVCAEITLKKELVVKTVSHIAGEVELHDWKPEPVAAPKEEEQKRKPESLTLNPEKEEEAVEPPRVSEEAAEFVKDLSDEDLARILVGHYSQDHGYASVVGEAANLVAGAAGQTTDEIEGVPALVMADGPAGLRLARDYVRDEKGARAVGDDLPAGMEELLGPVSGAVVKGTRLKKKKELEDQEILHQYCTAIPIGTALAQSFSPAAAEKCGDIVGDEMERFGIHLWLAPGMNIQRHPLCGRIFEYYSEDPVLTGLTAAAVTKGVQSHPGCGATIKHYCCNNQETNRFQNSSAVSERALRELYLRGFEIAIREADPVALMTSYNLLNGVHTSEREDLLKTVLRKEWGYGGLVMSDWVIRYMADRTAHYKVANAALSVQAGNDLFMPGSAADYRGIVMALRGKNPRCVLNRGEAEKSAARILDTAWRLVRERNR